MSFRLVAIAWEANIKSPGCKLVLMGLASYANEEGVCYPRQSTLAERTGQSERTVRDHIAWLEQNGYLERERSSSVNGRRADTYILLQPATSSACATGKKAQEQPEIFAGCSIVESVRTTNKEKRVSSKPKREGDHPIWEKWQRLNAQGFGVRHLSWTPAMEAMALAREKECKGFDFADVAGFAMEKMAENPWFELDKGKNRGAMTIIHLLSPKNFIRYTANYSPKAEA